MMTKGLGLLAALVAALLTLTGCATIQTIMDSKTAPDPAQDAATAATHTFYDSWARW